MALFNWVPYQGGGCHGPAQFAGPCRTIPKAASRQGAGKVSGQVHRAPQKTLFTAEAQWLRCGVFSNLKSVVVNLRNLRFTPPSPPAPTATPREIKFPIRLSIQLPGKGHGPLQSSPNLLPPRMLNRSVRMNMNVGAVLFLQLPLITSDHASTYPPPPASPCANSVMLLLLLRAQLPRAKWQGVPKP